MQINRAKPNIYILYIRLLEARLSYILNRWISLFVCSELIEELVGATDLKFGRGVGNTVSRNKF